MTLFAMLQEASTTSRPRNRSPCASGNVLPCSVEITLAISS